MKATFRALRLLTTLPFAWWPLLAAGAPFDAAPFALPLPEGHGLMWEVPREIHRVVVHFHEPVVAAEEVRLQYWGSRWPDQRLPKDREPGGGDVGWMELGNWFQYGWRTADAGVTVAGNALTFTPGKATRDLGIELGYSKRLGEFVQRGSMRITLSLSC